MRNERRRNGRWVSSRAETAASQVEQAFDVLGAMQRLRLGGRRRDDARVGCRRRAGAGQQSRKLAEGELLLLRDHHRPADVEHEIDARCNLLAIETHGEELRARIGGPVHMAEVIAGHVRAVILEFQRAAGSGAQTLTDASADRRPRHGKPKCGGGSHRGPVNRGRWHCPVLPLPAAGLFGSIGRRQHGHAPAHHRSARSKTSSPAPNPTGTGTTNQSRVSTTCQFNSVLIGLSRWRARIREIEDLGPPQHVVDEVGEQHRSGQQQQDRDSDMDNVRTPRWLQLRKANVGTPEKKQMYPHIASSHRTSDGYVLEQPAAPNRMAICAST